MGESSASARYKPVEPGFRCRPACSTARFRVKGTVRFADRTDVINLVGGRGEWVEWDGEPVTRLAFVAWDVEGATILERLETCRAGG